MALGPASNDRSRPASSGSCRLSLSRRTCDCLWCGRRSADGCDGPCLGYQHANPESAVDPAENRRLARLFLVPSDSAESRRRSILRHECIQHRELRYGCRRCKLIDRPTCTTLIFLAAALSALGARKGLACKAARRWPYCPADQPCADDGNQCGDQTGKSTTCGREGTPLFATGRGLGPATIPLLAK